MKERERERKRMRVYEREGEREEEKGGLVTHPDPHVASLVGKMVQQSLLLLQYEHILTSYKYTPTVRILPQVLQLN